MIRLFTFAHKRPDFIEMQLRSLEKNLTDEFELTVFNNAVFDSDRQASNYVAINEACFGLGIPVMAVQRDREIEERCQALEDRVERNGGARVELFDGRGEYSNPNIACAYPLCWAWERIISRQDSPVCVIDSDMFLAQSGSLIENLSDTPLCFVPMTRPNGVLYMWNALVLADLARLPEPGSMDWWCGEVNGHSVDVGGQTHHYLKQHMAELRVGMIGSERVDDEAQTGHEVLSIGGARLLHYLRGSNYNGQSDEFHRAKTRMFKEMLGL